MRNGCVYGKPNQWGLDQQTGEVAEEVLQLTRFRPLTEPSNADKFNGRWFARFCSNSKLLNPVHEREASI